MEYKPLPVGIDLFEHLITRGYYFIDKTLLIKDLLDKKGSVNLFTRPRRFGKTLNMSMLQYYFEDMRTENGEKTDNSALFEGLNILRAGERYTAHMGQYLVIFLTLKSAKRPTFDGAVTQLLMQISMEYRRHEYVLKANLAEADRIRYEAIMTGTAEPEHYNNSLQFLSRCLEKYYGKKVIILIDEYDVPLENAFHEGFYDEMVGFLRSFFEAALKTNASLEFAVITGCLRVSKESIFTGLNNLNVVSVLNSEFGEYFGFTDSEVKKICEDYGIPNNYEVIREWYDGYLFGEANVCNPWSVIKYMYSHAEHPDRFPEAYWANTSSNTIVRKLIEMAEYSVKQEIENLIAGGTIEKPVHEDITYDEVYESMDNLWNFMFFTGYFRKVSERMDEKTNIRYLTMRIPNIEVRYIFSSKIMAWFNEQMKARDLSVLYKAVRDKDAAAIEEELNDILLHTISYMDANESYYHGIMAGLLTGMPEYYLKSNREGGIGRSDLWALPVSRRKEAFIFEFKRAENIDDLERKAEETFAQMEDKNYAAEVRDLGYKQISYYAVAFYGKDCVVRHKDS